MDDALLIRVNVKFHPRDYPGLAQELRAAPKGARRHSRLLTLATIGLIAEDAIVGSPPRQALRTKPVEGSAAEHPAAMLGLSAADMTDLTS